MGAGWAMAARRPPMVSEGDHVRKYALHDFHAVDHDTKVADYLIAATRPSIMSEGDTTSAPARAWDTACRHRNSTVSSFMMTPASLTIPS